MGYFYGTRQGKNYRKKTPIEIKKLILKNIGTKRRTIAEISRHAKLNRFGLVRNLEELKVLGFVKETITTPTTRIFKLTEIGEDFASKIK